MIEASNMNQSQTDFPHLFHIQILWVEVDKRFKRFRIVQTIVNLICS